MKSKTFLLSAALLISQLPFYAVQAQTITPQELQQKRECRNNCIASRDICLLNAHSRCVSLNYSDIFWENMAEVFTLGCYENDEERYAKEKIKCEDTYQDCVSAC
jgi:hypothetical protein